MRTLIFSLVALLALAACSSGGNDQTAEPAADQAAEATTTPAETDAAGTTTAEVRTGEIEIAGTLGCGHCTHSIGENCSAAVQTADGAVYILEGLAEGDEPYDDRFSGKTITVRGGAVERDGVGYVTVTSFEMM